MKKSEKVAEKCIFPRPYCMGATNPPAWLQRALLALYRLNPRETPLFGGWSGRWIHNPPSKFCWRPTLRTRRFFLLSWNVHREKTVANRSRKSLALSALRISSGRGKSEIWRKLICRSSRVGSKAGARSTEKTKYDEKSYFGFFRVGNKAEARFAEKAKYSESHISVFSGLGAKWVLGLQRKRNMTKVMCRLFQDRRYSG